MKLHVKLIYCFVFLFFCSGVEAKSLVLTDTHFVSRINKDKVVRYSIYLPDSYETSNRNYPVLYLLHGFTGNHCDWVEKGQVKFIADDLITQGKADEMIIVMPDAGNSWYVNHFDGSNSYETMFFEELIPYIESTYRISKGREQRAIAGLSMGGFGTLIYALRHPDTFILAFAMSPAVWSGEEIDKMPSTDYKRYFGTMFGPMKDSLRQSTATRWAEYDILSLVNHFPEKEKDKLNLYITCGDDDFLFEGNANLWMAMRKNKIKMEFRVQNGSHTWGYWRDALREALPVASGYFHRF